LEVRLVNISHFRDANVHRKWRILADFEEFSGNWRILADFEEFSGNRRILADFGRNWRILADFAQF